MKQAYIYPKFDKANEFICSQASALERNGFTVSESMRDLRSIDLFVLNWYENIYRNSLFSFLKKSFFLLILKLFRKEIVFYVHNLQPHQKHDATPNIYFSNLLLRLLFKWSTRVVILSHNSAHYFGPSIKRLLTGCADKTFFIPHPNLVEYNTGNNAQVSRSSTLHLLSFGGEEKYKGIDVLIEVMNKLEDENVELWVVGACSDAQQNVLKNLSTNKRTHFKFEFIPNQDLHTLFSQFDLCVFPLDIQSCLNSSSILLAFSLGKTVVAPQIAVLDDFSSDTYFSYRYSNKEEHINNLYDVLLSLAEKKKKDGSFFIEKGLQCYEQVVLHNSSDKVFDGFAQMISSKR